MDIINGTTLMKKDYLKFNSFYMRRMQFRQPASLFLLTFLVLITIAFLRSGPAGLVEIAVLWAIFLLVFVLMSRRRVAKAADCQGVVSKSVYVFHECGLEASSQKDGIESKSQIQYARLTTAYETREAFYLFIDKHRALIVLKTGFSAGTADDLRVLLSRTIGRKFHPMKK